MPFAASRLACSTASIVLPEPAQPVTTMRLSRPKRLQQRRLLVGERDQRLLLVEELLRHRDLDPDRRREELAQLSTPLAPGAAACRAAPRWKARTRSIASSIVLQVVAVDDDLARRVGREHELVDGDVGERERVDDQQLAAALRRHPADLALEGVAVVERLL